MSGGSVCACRTGYDSPRTTRRILPFALAAAGHALLRAKGASFYGTDTPSQRRLATTVVITVPIVRFVATTAIETVSGKR